MEVQTILSATETTDLPTILVIEDEEDIANLLAYRLKREGFQIYRKRSGVPSVPSLNAPSPWAASPKKSFSTTG